MFHIAQTIHIYSYSPQNSNYSMFNFTFYSEFVYRQIFSYICSIKFLILQNRSFGMSVLGEYFISNSKTDIFPQKKLPRKNVIYSKYEILL